MNGSGSAFSQRGFSLIEVLIGMTLGLIMMAGLFVFFEANKTSYQAHEGVSVLQESGRYAIDQIRGDFRKSGYGGCLSPQDSPIVNLLVSSPPAHLQAIRDGEPISGQDDVSTVSVGGKAVISGTDVLDIRGPIRASMAFVASKIFPQQNVKVRGHGLGFAANEYLMIADCSGADIFRATSTAESTSGPSVTRIGHADTLNTRPTLSRKYNADSVVMELFIYTYFIGDTGRTSTDGRSILALYREDGSNNPEEILEGVENMQITYGLDSNNDNQADTFVAAGSVTDWGSVVNVEVSLLINSVEGAAQEEVDYVYLPVSSHSVSPSTGDYRMRQEFTSVISLRNGVM